MKKLLIANRGEIALRVMRTAKEMGLSTVAVYSEADRNSPHVKYADEAVCIGPPPSDQSYLLANTIIKVCKELNVDAIHPGYGFLSENASFARKVKRAGITFVGPTPKAIEVMGNKLAAKECLRKFNGLASLTTGIPMVPGTDKPIKNIAAAKKTAKKIGFPILIKAAAGGGGKGMRIVEKEKEFEEQMELAVSEATSAFGDGAVFIEKYISSPRHIEIQILADTHGNIVHLFERECSIQRRHQKVIEEAPSSVLTPALRQQMGQAAIDVARSCKYVGAGTIEFLYDNELFYFLEMNTRLQVEHPVTECITGVDLVREQLLIAQGKKLSFNQDDLQINGHALEVRVYAEDPANNFFPDIGKLNVYKRPHGIGVRVDDGYEEGMDIPIYYDPMISKLITYGSNRKEAMSRMLRAIDDYTIAGVQTTLGFCAYVLKHKAFKSGNYDTHFVQKYFTSPDVLFVRSQKEEEIAAILGARLVEQNGVIKPAANGVGKRSAWKANRLAEPE